MPIARAVAATTVPAHFRACDAASRCRPSASAICLGGADAAGDRAYEAAGDPRAGAGGINVVDSAISTTGTAAEL